MAIKINREWQNFRFATIDRSGYGIIENSAIACINGNIVWVGPDDKLPNIPVEEEIHFEDRWVTPSLINCHTHLVHAGKRAQEFEKRLNGASYEEIPNADGGIISTVASTHQASKQQLIDQSLPRLRLNRVMA